MMIFYDFETSSRELLGQVLSYAFVCVDDGLVPQSQLTGLIRLNRLQLPEPEAIWVNKLDLAMLQAQGEPEYEAAQKIMDFLSACVQKNGACTLAGFNSNAFDLQFLRNLLIRYGHNPYFKGALQNLDVLHFCQWVAVTHPETFPWTEALNEQGNPYFSFKLETLSQAFELQSTPQTHDALDDVLLTLSLVTHLQSRYHVSFAQFKPIQLPVNSHYQADLNLAKQELASTRKPLYWLKLFQNKKDFVLVNLEKWDSMTQDTEAEKLACLKYLNPNKHFFVIDPLSTPETQRWEPIAEQILQDPFIQQLTPALYFQKIKKNWDIEFQIHELGFERIELLKGLVDRFLNSPYRYPDLLDTLKKRMSLNTVDQKDVYLTQLFNRVYLNWHPSPNPEHLKRYLIPRYVTGTMLKNPAELRSLSDRLHVIESHLNTHTDPDSQRILTHLKDYTVAFGAMIPTD